MRTQERIRTDYGRGFDAGWEACEKFYEQMALTRDPGFQAWLDKLERLGHVQRERDELALQQQQWAMQQSDDDQTH